MSILSGWLNACAFCRVQREAYREGDMEGWEAGGRGGAAVVQAACREDVTGEWVAWARAEPHLKHVLHVCDFGRVEAQRLVEHRRRLPSPKGGIP